jgi:hypothetical protein
MASLKQAISQKCKDCTYDPAEKGSWREQVEACTVTSCALHPVRPMTVATITLHRNKRATGGEVDVDGILAGLEDEEDTPEAVAA